MKKKLINVLMIGAIALSNGCAGLGGFGPSKRVQQGAFEGAIRPIVKPIIAEAEEPFHLKTEFQFKSIETKLKVLEDAVNILTTANSTLRADLSGQQKKFDVLYDFCLKNIKNGKVAVKGRR